MDDLLRAWVDALPEPTILLEAVRDEDGMVVDFVRRDFNRATQELFGVERAELLGSFMLAGGHRSYSPELMERLRECLRTGVTLALNEVRYDRDDPSLYGDIQVARVGTDLLAVSSRNVSDRVALEQERDAARLEQAESDDRFRRLMETSNVGMVLATPDGKFAVVNRAFCEQRGYDEEKLKTMSWKDLTPVSHWAEDTKNTEDLLAGRLDTYRIIKQHIHADGHLIWIDLSVSCLRNSQGEVQYFAAQSIDITEQVEARERITQQEKQNRELAQRLADELSSAAHYVTSILPGELEGPVRVTSQYLPSQRLGGDSFDYRWLDDDHLMVYLIDVSGHGVDAALLSVSVHNVLRTGSFSPATLLAPDKVLTELNRLFQMRNQGNRFFTIWYGVYQKSTRQLRYASAGHPPALAFDIHGNTATSTALSTKCLPIGVLADAEFVSDSHQMAHGGKLMVFSDGAYELIDTHGRWWSLENFIEVCRECAAQQGCSLDALVARIQQIAADGNLPDDCALIELSFD